MKSGIYQIMNVTNGKSYIGSAKNLTTRKKQHFTSLRKGKGVNKKFQYAFDKYGEDSFMFTTLEYCDIDKLIEREQHYFDVLLLANSDCSFFNKNSYNIRRIAESNLGCVTSDETKKKLSEANKGKVITQEVRDKIAETLSGTKHTKERIENMIKNKKKFHHTEDSKQKIGYNCPHRKPVLQLDKNTGELILEWQSKSLAQNELKIQHIEAVCRGERKSAGGFNWKWK